MDARHTPAWLATTFGERVRAWERATLRRMCEKIFGHTALNMGKPLEVLADNAISGAQFCAQFHPPLSDDDTLSLVANFENGDSHKKVKIITDPAALPFHNNSIDVIIAHHVLEIHDDPSALLREWYRVLNLNGYLVMTLFNPHSTLRFSPWMRSQFSDQWKKLTTHRINDWLRLLGLSVNQARFGVYCPPWQEFPGWINQKPSNSLNSDKCSVLDKIDLIGNRWFPTLGAVLVVVAQKRMLRATSVGQVRSWALKPRWQTQNANGKYVTKNQ